MAQNDILLESLGARERQIMDALFMLGEAAVAQVLAELASPPSYSAVRGMLTLLERKGLVSHRREGLRYLYSPTVAPGKAKKRALKNVVATFFKGSPERAVSALLGLDEETPIDLDKLRAVVEKSRRSKS
ncbi:MAG: BlaI/MecI/CopY family transcriptional regulator [Gemmatimonadales bacterium]